MNQKKRCNLLNSKFSKASAAALTLALVSIPAWSASAVTNPAANPHPITVTGDDGNIYHDGLDTLPGYDDEECTYIPGAYFDFAKNLVHYADGKSIPWTEWDRASGYKVWQTSQKSSTSKPTATATPVANSSTTSNSAKNESNATVSSAPEASAAAVEVISETNIETPVAVSASAPATSNPGHETGLLILGALAVFGAVTVLVQSARRRIGRGGNL
jgi:hypothetical protein